MKRFFVLMTGLMLVAGMAFAAEMPESKVDVFGGYQYGRFRGLNGNGWNASLTGNYNKYLGLVADFSGTSGDRRHNYSFLFGPRVSTSLKRVGRVKPFAHVLFGADHSSDDWNGLSDTSWAVVLGGGVDVNVHKHVSLRLGQADWLRTKHFSDGQDKFRYSTGVVFHFGGK